MSVHGIQCLEKGMIFVFVLFSLLESIRRCAFIQFMKKIISILAVCLKAALCVALGLHRITVFTRRHHKFIELDQRRRRWTKQKLLPNEDEQSNFVYVVRHTMKIH